MLLSDRGHGLIQDAGVSSGYLHHRVLETLVWLDGFEAGKAAINPAAILRPAHPGRVDT